MKKLKLFISLWFTMFSMVVFGQAEYEKIAITANTQDNSAGRLLVQDVTTGEVRWILKSILDNKFNQPTGNATQYLDGAGTPTTFPVLGQSDRVITEVRNSTGATITKGTVVYLNGATGGKPNVQKAQANAEATSSGTFGVIQSDINNNSNGYVVVIGTILGLNTSAYTAGQVLWLSPTTAGGFTTTKPVAPNHSVYVGIVTLAATQGTIEVKIQNGYELDEIHDVLITSKTDNDGLIYESASGLWKNKQITKAMVGLANVDNTSDLNKPISTATQTALNLKENTANKNTANGYAGLGSDGKLISSQLPSITITDTFVVDSQSEMLSLVAETGDVAVRTDVNKSFILQGDTPSDLADWQELLTPTSAVSSVFGRTGAVTSNSGDYTADQISETASRKFQTLAQQTYNDATSSIQTQLNAKENLSNKSTSTALGNSDTLYPTQNAVKVYVDGKIGGGDFANVVYVDSTDPNTATIFDLNNPPVTNNNSLKNDIGNLYIGTNNSTWTYKTSPAGYYTYTVSSTSSNFYLTATTVDAGSNKISEIQRAGAIKASAFKVINGSSSQFLKGNGALDTNTYTPTSRTITINGITQDLSVNRSWTINGLPSMLEYSDTDKTLWNNGKGNINSNTSFGDGALKSNTTGSNNTSVGYNSLFTNTTGTFNTAFGDGSLYDNTTGNSNTSIGISSLSDNTTGGANTAVGINSLAFNTTAGNNTGIGTNSLSYLTTGAGNTGIGTAAGRFITNGINANSTGSNSVFLGYNTKAAADGETNQIVIGHTAIGNGSNSVTLGNTDITKTILRGNVGIGTTTVSSITDQRVLELNANKYATILASSGTVKFSLTANSDSGWGALATESDHPFAMFTNSVERMRITSDGNVLIGQTTPSGSTDGIYLRKGVESGFIVTNDNALQLSRYSSNGDIETFFRDGTKVGSISVTTTLTSYNITSDYRLKQDFKPFNGLDLLSRIKVYDYQWKADNTRMKGVIAHELQEVVPYAVRGEKDGKEMQQVDYSKLVPILIQSIQELKAEIDILKNK